MQTNQLKQKDPKEWSYVLFTQEITSNIPQHIVDVIKDFPKLSNFKWWRIQSWKYHLPFLISNISFDWTNANTGIKNGIAAILNRERKEKNVADLFVVCKNFNESKKEMFVDFKEFKMDC
jgi:hypothetical protein